MWNTWKQLFIHADCNATGVSKLHFHSQLCNFNVIYIIDEFEGWLTFHNLKEMGLRDQDKSIIGWHGHAKTTFWLVSLIGVNHLSVLEHRLSLQIKPKSNFTSEFQYSSILLFSEKFLIVWIILYELVHYIKIISYFMR